MLSGDLGTGKAILRDYITRPSARGPERRHRHAA